MRLADVALPVPLAGPLTYSVPDALAVSVVPGARVLVPLASRQLVGVVMALRDGAPPANVRPVARVLDIVPAVPLDLLALLREISVYYLAPIGEVLKLALPPMDQAATHREGELSLFSPRRKGVGPRLALWATRIAGTQPTRALRGRAVAIFRHLDVSGDAPIATLEKSWRGARAVCARLAAVGLVRVEKRVALEAPFFEEPAQRDVPPELTVAQREAVLAIDEALESGVAQTFLLHGVTGSGKTEVYFRAIATARARAKGAIVLVPEIALTPQLVGRFRARFGDDVAVLHSGLTPKERSAMWHRLRRGEVDVAIGARSALFAPVRDLGLIVVDEEHDPSFKQEEGVRYNARDMAILRAHRARAVVVLGSATPSLESEYLTRVGRARKLRLPARAGARELPVVEVIDLRRMGAGPTGDRRLSLPLHRALEETLARGEQAILFLNRRGFAPSVRCAACGKVVECTHCSVALTFHRRSGSHVRCHYCDFEGPLPVQCPSCKAEALELEGLGTERLEDVLTAAFPTARIARLDRDVASGKAIERVLARMRNGEVDALVGTQMVTKGHDLPLVTLVGVINADAALSMPDFRASERAFQLMVQVAGRAGRADRKGRVLIQTYDPDHPAIALARHHDVDGFFERELADRKELGYPPFARATLVRVDAADEAVASRTAAALTVVARSAGAGVTVSGPAPAPIARVRGRFRYRALLRSADRAALRRAVSAVDRARANVPRGVRVVIDVDPVQLL